jgi:hypothetical protein
MGNTDIRNADGTFNKTVELLSRRQFIAVYRMFIIHCRGWI